MKLISFIKVGILLCLVLTNSCTKLEKVSLVSTGYATDIKSNSVEVSGTIIDLGEGATAYGFCYGKTRNLTFANNNIMLGVPLETGDFKGNLPGLDAGTTYYYMAYLSNGPVTVFGKALPITTLNITSTLPSSTISDVTNVTNTSATASGAVLANGSHTTVVFEYGASGQFSFFVAAVPDTISGTSITMVNAELIGLTPGTLYSVRIKAVKAAGTSCSNILTFVTTQIPLAETIAATNITNNAAKLNGSANSFNVSTTVTFQYGLTVSYGLNATAGQSPLIGSTLTDVDASINGLSRDRTYHFRIKAENASGITYGEDKTFKTSK